MTGLQIFKWHEKLQLQLRRPLALTCAVLISKAYKQNGTLLAYSPVKDLSVAEMERTASHPYTVVKNKTSSRIKCIDETHADFLFTKAVQRLLDVNNWQHYSGKMSCRFHQPIMQEYTSTSLQKKHYKN